MSKKQHQAQLCLDFGNAKIEAIRYFLLGHQITIGGYQYSELEFKRIVQQLQDYSLASVATILASVTSYVHSPINAFHIKSRIHWIKATSPHRINLDMGGNLKTFARDEFNEW